ncbi:MAG: hypothetical protein R3D80_03115 [Paracoccaceae bacterium]
MTESLMGQFINGFNVSIFWWLGFVAVFFYVLHLACRQLDFRCGWRQGQRPQRRHRPPRSPSAAAWPRP